MTTHLLLIFTPREIELLDTYIGQTAREARNWADLHDNRNERILAGQLETLHEKIQQTAVPLIDITPPGQS